MKNLLLCLCAIALTTTVFAQKIEVGINGGTAHNSTPVFSDYPYKMTTFANSKVSPVISANCGYSFKKWQLRLSVAQQTLRSKYEVVKNGYSGDFLSKEEPDFHVSQVNLALNRTIYSKGVKIYAGLSAGFAIVGKLRYYGFSTGLHTGMTYPLSKHFAANVEIDGQFFRFGEREHRSSVRNPSPAITFNSRSIGTTVGVLYRF